MMNRDTATGVLLVVASALAACFGSGCNAFSRPKSMSATSPRVYVEDVDASPPMTPAEKENAFRLHYSEGVELASKGQYGLALAAFEQAARIYPESAETLFNLAACYDAVGDPMRAIAIYRELLQVTPDDPDCYANLGTSFIKMYHRERSPAWRKMAWEAWEHSLRLKPEQPMVRSYLARSREMD